MGTTESVGFGTDEIEALVEWIRGGGSLLLIADHQPWPAAAAELASSLGVIFHNGYAQPISTGDGVDVFRTSDGSLRPHKIVSGRSTRESVSAVATFGGQAFRARPGVDLEPLLVFPAGTELVMLQDPFGPEVDPRRLPVIQIEGMFQGAVLRVGDGRVAFFGEAAMFTAQSIGPNRLPMGMNHPSARENAQFVLNVMHWLLGLIPSEPE